MSSPDFGRRGSTGTFADTIAEKSAEQAMLLQLDQMVALLNKIQAAVAASTDGPSLYTNLAAAGLTQLSLIKLKP